TSVELLGPGGDAVIVYSLDGSEPGEDSLRYTGPITIQDDATVSARVLVPGSPPTLSDVAVCRFERIEAKRATECRVNFQLASSPRPEGYLIDSGEAFDVRDGGYAYGWSADNTEAARERGKQADTVLDTLVHFTAGVVWEIAVENGAYDVTVCIGDAEYPSEANTLWVEDVAFCEGMEQPAGEFERITKRVAVTDGKLTFRSNDAPHGPRLTRMNAVEIAPAE
ncbi:MAG: chitobiase/beta-hexosaminidase C-terminal domain-containing protein, partial [Candidatus Hydrogenedentes bacterium]|nr:chitobiase/beta-hexosaminidase C-terminal domain-containing protein [Candidatus Hydrogenedentota bacterium]